MIKKMNTQFGKLKNKILKKLTELYSTDNKKELKSLINKINENKDFKEMYLFYENIENLELSYPESAKLYVETIGPLLNTKSILIKNLVKELSIILEDVDSDENEVYSLLDVLSENTSIHNLDKKVIAKEKLIEHLSTKKTIEENIVKEYTSNEKLLMTLLSNDFNSFYDKTMSEEEKNKLVDILNTKDIDIKIQELSETITKKINKILLENSDSDIVAKLDKVKKDVSNITPTKYNYYKLLELKNGLD